MSAARPPRGGLGLVHLEPVKPKVLAARTLSWVDPQLAHAWKVPEGRRALGLLTCSSDDALFVALDEGTKAAPVEVTYARSFYAGSSYPSGPLSGEALGVFAGDDPDQIRAALDACLRCLDDEAWFYAAPVAGVDGGAASSTVLFPHVIRSTGTYLSREAGIPAGAPMAYLIAPPLEAMVGVDAALKAAPSRLVKLFGPPTETNFGGAWLSGELPDLEAAACAFAAAVVDVAAAPTAQGREARGGGEALIWKAPAEAPRIARPR